MAALPVCNQNVFISCVSSFLSLIYLFFLFRDQAVEDDEEEDEGLPPDQNPTHEMDDAAEAPNDENDKGEEEDDELAEYGLDKYDEEDLGEEWSVCV